AGFAPRLLVGLLRVARVKRARHAEAGQRRLLDDVHLGQCAAGVDLRLQCRRRQGACQSEGEPRPEPGLHSSTAGMYGSRPTGTVRRLLSVAVSTMVRSSDWPLAT